MNNHIENCSFEMTGVKLDAKTSKAFEAVAHAMEAHSEALAELAKALQSQSNKGVGPAIHLQGGQS